MEAGVHLSVIYKDEDLLELTIAATNGLFSGTTDLYVSFAALDAFITSLRGFPTTASDVRECELGTFQRGWAGGGVRFRVYCRDAAGHSAVEIYLQTQPDSANASSAHFHILVEPAAVDQFVRELAAISPSVYAFEEARLAAVR